MGKGLGEMRDKFQSGHFFIAAHQIHILDCLAGGTFNNIIDCGHDNDTACGSVYFKRNIAEIGPPYVLGSRKNVFIKQADERFCGVHLFVKFVNGGLVEFRV